MILVLEYMSNGNLGKALSGTNIASITFEGSVSKD